LSSGHIPGSISLPFQKLINPKTGQFHDLEHIRDFFESQLDSLKDTITSCGTGSWHLLLVIVGVTAGILFLALEASGFPSKKSIYDGSWTEYATRHANDPDMIIKSR
jgi:thiosulfate/3-mercaptopyruvate sulfurtransferase